jgi:hypothetical protein
LNCRAGPIGEQSEHGSTASQFVAPEIQLHPGYVTLHPLSLPNREIRKLDWQLGKRRRPAIREGPVDFQQLVQKNIKGPAVVNQVMFDVKQHMIFFAKVKEEPTN